jgi:hypothetical protein
MLRLDRNVHAVNDLDDLAEMPRWVAWREEDRERNDGTELKTKIPYDPNGNGQAKIPTEPSTWGTRAEAKRRWSRLNDGSRGGIGVVLGDLGDGHHLLGLDLDRCIKKQTADDMILDPIADKIIERFNTYGERSPSGKGIKLIFRVKSSAMEAVKQVLDFKTRRAFTADKHREVAIDLARYYAVTGEALDGNQRFRVIDIKDVRWFVEQAGPEFLRRYRPAGVNETHSRDKSGSGFGYRYFASCKALRKTFPQAWEAIIIDRARPANGHGGWTCASCNGPGITPRCVCSRTS